MEKLIKKFNNFVMSYNNNEKEDQVDLLIAWFDIIIGMMDIIMVEDYTIIKKLVSFVKLITTEDYIDDDLRIQIYHRQIFPLLEDLEDRYADTSSKTVADIVDEFTETQYSEDIESIFRVHKTISDIDTNIINNLDQNNLLEYLTTAREYLYGHYRNIVNNDIEISSVPLEDLQLKINELSCKLSITHIYKQVVTNLGIICGLLMSLKVNKDSSRMIPFKRIINGSFKNIDVILGGFT